jgi:hypothetical protein
MTMSYVLVVRPAFADSMLDRARTVVSTVVPRLAPAAAGVDASVPASGSGSVANAQLSDATMQRTATAVEAPALDTSGAATPVEVGFDDEPTPRLNCERRSRLFAVLVPAAFGALLVYMLLGRFTDLVEVEDGAGAGLVGGTAALLLLLVSMSSEGFKSLEACATHVVDGLAFAFKAMGIVIPIAGFVFMGISDFSGRVMGLPETQTAPAFLFDAIRSVQDSIPNNPVIIMLAVLLAGMMVGLDGSGWPGLPLTGSLSEALSPAAGVDTATLAAIAQNGASWTGGGTLLIWSSLIAVATFCGVSVVELARKLFLPVVTGLVVATLLAGVIW